MSKLHQFKIYVKFCHRNSYKSAVSFSTLASPLILAENDGFPMGSRRRTQRYELAKLLQLPVSGKPILYCKKIHGHIVVSGFQFDTFIANILVRVYANCGRIWDARKVFDKMPERNLVSWSSGISMYAQHGYSEEALWAFLKFLRNCVEKPNEYILASVVRSCAQLGGVDCGGQMHGFVIKMGFHQDVYVGTSLIDFYAKNGNIEEARVVFDGLLEKTAVTWTTIITGYVKSGRSEVSLQLFEEMRETNVIPDKYVLSSILTACLMLKFVEAGKQIHAHVLRRGTEMDISVVNVLIDFYSKCGRVNTGRKLFDQMVAKNVVSWTTMIAGYMQNSFDRDAMKLFAEMTQSGLKPDGYACTSILTSCGSLEALIQGRQVHAYIIKINLEHDDFVKNGLIDMYAKCNSLTDARVAFNVIHDRNVVSYNAMIEGYSRQEKIFEALHLFCDMRLKLFPPSLLTFVSLLGISASLFTLELSKQIHGLIIKFGVSLDIFAGSSLIDVYSKCFSISDARLVFEEISEKDIVMWNAMISGYSQQLENEKVLKLFTELQISRHKPDEFTYAATITAVSNLASATHGQQLHNQVIKTGLENVPFVTNALVDMYSKCGMIEEARITFNFAILRDVACWNSMISMYAHHGEAEEALHMFERMTREGMKPNYITFVGILSACSHAGLIDYGFSHFESMPSFGIERGMEHYACMVSLLGRAGKVIEARNFIEKMPIKPTAMVWRSLLSACRISGNVELGRYAADMAISIDPMDSGSYTLLSNIFASKGMWVNVKNVRERMDFEGVVKEPGRSWIEVKNDVHVFIARDTTHREADLIYLVLDYLIMQLKGVGYMPDTTTLQMND